MGLPATPATFPADFVAAVTNHTESSVRGRIAPVLDAAVRVHAMRSASLAHAMRSIRSARTCFNASTQAALLNAETAAAFAHAVRRGALSYELPFFVAITGMPPSAHTRTAATSSASSSSGVCAVFVVTMCEIV